MKKRIFLAFFLFSIIGIFQPTHAQIFKNILKNKAKESGARAAGQVMDTAVQLGAQQILHKAADNIRNGNKNKDKKKKSDSPNTDNTAENSAENSVTGDTNTLGYKTKFDFVPGDKIVVYEDFSQDAVGDFPDKWNTNSSGEIVTLNNDDAHWLMLSKVGLFVPEYITALPDNFTLQFDILVNPDFHAHSNALRMYLMDGDNGKKDLDNTYRYHIKRSGVILSFLPKDASRNPSPSSIGMLSFDKGEKVLSNNTSTEQFSATGGKNLVKISLWRQGQRLRMYMNEDKVIDAPRALAPGMKYQNVAFEIEFPLKENDRYLIGNFRLAVGAPDLRNKLLNEGKFSTTGILFDVNSDKIKPESYGVLKEIASVLKDNNSLKVKIIGYTDSDGSAAANLDLSKRRAAAVKALLIKDFGIDDSRMSTDGKGASDPVAPNTTAAGKAQNRRVEFVKM